MKRTLTIVFFLVSFAGYSQVWDKAKAANWYKSNPWLTGCNYLPATAINQLEMWQAETFDTATIEKELALAESIGFTTLRVFLHDKLWVQDAAGFKKRIDIFLSICKRHNIKPILVFFDSCWDPFSETGTQRDPEPGLHNSGWVQSPGALILQHKEQYLMLEKYVKDIVKTFRNDKRILMWDLWNEPDNINTSSYGKLEPENKVALVNALLPKVFLWARSQQPVQPLTSGVWTSEKNGWSKESIANRTETEKIQFANSDIITFHQYGNATDFEKYVKELKTNGRPIICTEYMARGNLSTVLSIMPVGKKYNVGLINWGFVDGKEQTKYPWDSWEKRYTKDPVPWHHDLFTKDLKPYKPEEIAFIKQMNAAVLNKPKQPVSIIFDTDIGPDYDDIGAITLLHAMADNNECNILATMASNQHPLIAPVLDVMNTYFNRPNIPVGVVRGKAVNLPAWQKWDSLIVADYPHNIKTNEDAQDALKLYRKILSKQPDNSVTIVTVGFTTNMANLLQSEPDEFSPLSGEALVKKKVKLLVSMAANFGKEMGTFREFNVKEDSAASKFVFDQWPTPIIFSGFEIGAKIHTGIPIVNSGITHSPVKDVFARCIPLDPNDANGRMSWDETAVLVAVRGYQKYFDVVKGKIICNINGSNGWDKNGNRDLYLVQKMPIPEIETVLNDLIMHQPEKKE